MHGPLQITRDCADQRLLSALHEAQSLVRAYDTKAQILGVGYILALNLALLVVPGIVPSPCPFSMAR